jgi:hypothetical protein
MATINAEQTTVDRFNDCKLKQSAKDSKNYSQEDFVNFLLDKLEGKKK